MLAKFLVYYAIPLTIIGFFYILMARHLILSTRNMPGEIQGQARQITARKKVAKTVLDFVVIFAVCVFPQHVFMLWFYSHSTARGSNSHGSTARRLSKITIASGTRFAY